MFDECHNMVARIRKTTAFPKILHLPQATANPASAPRRRRTKPTNMGRVRRTGGNRPHRRPRARSRSERVPLAAVRSAPCRRRSGLRNLYLLQWAGSEMVRRCLENAGRPFLEIAAFWVRHRTCPMPEIKLVYPYRSLRVFLCTSIRITKSLIST
jgi:hypothetical protein